MTEIKLIRDDDKATKILAAVAQIDAGVELAPIVRCKDCKHARGKTKNESAYLVEDVLICTNPEVYEDCWGAVWSCHFCSCGGRKTDDC